MQSTDFKSIVSPLILRKAPDRQPSKPKPPTDRKGTSPSRRSSTRKSY